MVEHHGGPHRVSRNSTPSLHATSALYNTTRNPSEALARGATVDPSSPKFAVSPRPVRLSRRAARTARRGAARPRSRGRGSPRLRAFLARAGAYGARARALRRDGWAEALAVLETFIAELQRAQRPQPGSLMLGAWRFA